MHWVYILYSESIDFFYCRSSEFYVDFDPSKAYLQKWQFSTSSLALYIYLLVPKLLQNAMHVTVEKQSAFSLEIQF